MPTGNTQFQFHEASFNFSSSSYDWLVVAGARAQYKGSGTVNGSYGFLLTAIDGELPGGGGQDKFRIKIWDKNNNNGVVHNNQMGAGDTADHHGSRRRGYQHPQQWQQPTAARRNGQRRRQQGARYTPVVGQPVCRRARWRRQQALIDGSVPLTKSGASLRPVLNDWISYRANVSRFRSRLAVTDNSSYHNPLLAGSGLDWFWETSAGDTTNRKATDLLN